MSHSKEPMAMTCSFCGSSRVHRSHRYGLDFLVSVLTGRFPHRCSACNSRFRMKRARKSRNPAAQEQPSEAPPRRDRKGPAKPKPKPKVTRRVSLREIALYLVALAAFAAFLRWISEDRPESPQP